MRAGSVGHCPGQRHGRSHRLAPGQMRRMEVEPDEAVEEPVPAADEEPWGLLFYFRMIGPSVAP